jgi:hypothetical protein
MRWLSSILLMASAALFVVAGEVPPVLAPAILIGISGLWAWDRGGKPRPEARPPVQPVPEDRIRPLEQRLMSMQDELAATQRQLLQLGEERDFLRRLYPTTQADRISTGDQYRR